MYNKKSIVLFCLVLFFSMVCLVYADSSIPEFMIIHGNLEINGNGAPQNTIIMAYIENDNDPLIEDGMAIVDNNGQYMILITGYIYDQDKTIKFVINNTEAYETTSFTPKDIVELNLTVDFPPKIYCDFNNDQKVNIIDLIIVRRAFGTTPGNPEWNEEFDLNGDGSIDILDLVITRRNFT